MNHKLLGQRILVQFTNLLNRFLNLDTDLQHILKPLQGHSIQIHVVDYPVLALLTVCEDGFLISFEEDNLPTVALSGCLVDLISLCIYKNPQTLLQQNLVQLTGSLQVLMDFSRFCQRFAPDIEGALSRWLGPTVSHHTYRASKASLSWLKKNMKLAQADCIEYLQEEIRLIPSMKEFNAFISDIHDVQSDVDRFEAKFQVFLHEEQ